MFYKFYKKSIFLIVLTLIFISGCKKEANPVTPPSDHFEPEGWVIRDATLKPILVVFQGKILTNFKGDVVKDTLYAPLNALSPHYSIRFLDANQNLMNPPSGNDHRLGWKIVDTTYLTVIQDSPTDWAFHLKGKKVGITKLELQVRHGSHSDVITPPIPVVIAVDTTAHGEPIGVKLTFEEDGVFIAEATKDSSNGFIEIKKDSSSDHIKIEFFDEFGHLFQPEYPLHQLGIVVGNNAVAEVIPETNEPWVIRVKGKAIGSTSLILKVLVGSDEEYVSAPIEIRIVN